MHRTRPSRSVRTDGGLVPAALVLVALAWGVSFSAVKAALTGVPPAGLVTWRFAVAAAVLLLLRPRCLRGVRRRTLAEGAVLGSLLGVGFLLHSWGMTSTPVVVSAFLTGTVVVFAPLVARVWLGRRSGPRTLAAVVLTVTGLAGMGLRGTGAGWGALLVVGAALVWALQLVALEVWARPGEAYASTVVQLATVAALGAVVQLVGGHALRLPRDPGAGLALLGLGVLGTAGAFLLLSWAQARTDATTSALVLTLEPVFGAATAMVLGERLPLPVLAGALAVLVGALLVVPRGVRRGASRVLVPG